ncbi:Patellin-3 [Forsythia ovata]|uniref:Patellin-3 n=1 Tax=Forsythia ovata TaxID=205694 RepID=A0ABD1U7W9_9LAMI
MPKEEGEETTPLPLPEEVKIWRIPLLEDKKSDVILLKFLRARDFQGQRSFFHAKNCHRLEKRIQNSERRRARKIAYLHGVDKEGHLVCYNAFREFQDKELYNKTFAGCSKKGPNS